MESGHLRKGANFAVILSKEKQAFLETAQSFNMKGALAETGSEYYEMTGCAKEAIIRFLDEAEK